VRRVEYAGCLRVIGRDGTGWANPDVASGVGRDRADVSDGLDPARHAVSVHALAQRGQLAESCERNV